ncbi:MAG: SGNH/GDSL hydrolase family protein [Patescibacteria group bacterium]
MKQIFLIGSSFVYGVGGENGGWGDYLKQALHQKMYSEGGVGEKYEVYNFSKPGATIDFAIKNFPTWLEQYGRDGEIITIVSTGGNNVKAKNTPDNFVSTVDDYINQMSELLDILKKGSSHVIAVGGGFYDESKTNPKSSPFDGEQSYFKNDRKQLFESHFKQLCQEKDITFIPLDIDENSWKANYLYKDGLHSNMAGHKLISQKVLNEVEKLL